MGCAVWGLQCIGFAISKASTIWEEIHEMRVGMLNPTGSTESIDAPTKPSYSRKLAPQSCTTLPRAQMWFMRESYYQDTVEIDFPNLGA